jgi:hypothetical protein
VRIPDGDLMPARRHRYTGGYGGRRRRGLRRGALLLVVVVVAAAAAWFLRRDDDTPATQALAPCPTPSASATPAAVPLPANRQVRLVLLNGTARNGLAQQVGTALTARGFVVLREDNAPAAVAGASLVTYGPGAGAAATVLSRNVLGAQLVSAPRARAGSLQLVLGGDFRRLATVAEVAAAAARPVVPAVSAAPTRSPCSA